MHILSSCNNILYSAFIVKHDYYMWFKNLTVLVPIKSFCANFIIISYFSETSRGEKVSKICKLRKGVYHV